MNILTTCSRHCCAYAGQIHPTEHGSAFTNNQSRVSSTRDRQFNELTDSCMNVVDDTFCKCLQTIATTASDYVYSEFT